MVKTDYYKGMHSDEDQKKASIAFLAAKWGCNPWQVNDNYKKQLREDNFKKSELLELIAQCNLRKKVEGDFFGINPENTVSAHTTRWAQEYLDENF